MNLGSGLSSHLPSLIVRALSSLLLRVTFSVYVLLELSTLIFGEEGAGTSVIMIQLGRITTVQKFINESLIAHEYLMLGLGDCFNDDINMSLSS